MLIATSRSTNPISSILLLVVFWLVNFSLSLREVLLYQSSWSNFIFLKMVSAHLSIIGISILLNKVLQKNKIVGVGDVFSGLFFLIFMISIPNTHEYYKDLASLFLITIGNNRLVTLHNSNKNYLKEFEIGILFGLSILIAPHLFTVIIALLIGIALVISFTWRDFVVPLLGFLWVFFIKYIVFYIFDISGPNPISDFNFSLPQFGFSFDLYNILIVLVFMFQFIVFLKIFSILEKRSIRERVFYRLWIWTMLFLVISVFFFSKRISGVFFILLLALPISLFSVEFFPRKRELKGYWRKEVLIYLIIFLQFYLRIY